MTTQAEFLDKVKAHLKLRFDAQLAREIDEKPPVISKIRNNKLTLGATNLMRIHELTGFPIRQMKSDLGLECLASHMTKAPLAA